MYYYPVILLTLSSPYFKQLKDSWRRNKRALLDTTEQLNYILSETQTDVYNQFLEKQSVWKPLAKFTVEKKKKAKSDRRILHERKNGLRLKDGYARAGEVDNQKLIYHYPPEFPFAHEHQDGAVIDSVREAKPKTIAQRKRDQNRKNRDKNLHRQLDIEFLRAVGLPDYLAGV